MSLLTIIQNAAIAIGVDKPTSVIGNTDITAIELLEFAQREGAWLTLRHDWQLLTKEQTFTSTATETQASAIPTDFERFVNETFWNRSKKLPLTGPLSAQEWQQIKACSTNPTTNCFRIRGGALIMNPVPTAGETMAFEYITKNWCASAGGTAQSAFAADTDTTVLDETMIKLGTIVRFKMAKGFPYDEDMAQYEAFVLAKIMGEKPKKTEDMSGASAMRVPAVGVQEGSWSL